MSVNFHKIMSDEFKVQVNLITICSAKLHQFNYRTEKSRTKTLQKKKKTLFIESKLNKLGHNRQQNHIFY